jgi:hypothetical protein
MISSSQPGEYINSSETPSSFKTASKLGNGLSHAAHNFRRVVLLAAELQ